MNEPDRATEPASDVYKPTGSHPIAQGVGATGGGVAGAAIGHSIGGKVGAVVGGVAGVIAGGMAGETIAEVADELLQETKPSLGLSADAKAIELPDHYSWEELQALSQLQPDKNKSS